ncbi:MAG: type III pantothenate kinase [Erysipelotrichaceae bacterium]|jgi:type III pantothenate kinase|nr:type III pantothenate kinase [Erysipelotrichaceae bacterium]
MILTIDIGNSDLVAILYDGQGQILQRSRVKTARENIEDYYRKWAKDFCGSQSVDAWVLSCVVPGIFAQVNEVFKAFFHKEGLVISADKAPGFVCSLKNPSELGADLVATAIGALAQYPAPILIADLGSAGKITAINQDGVFVGGVIFPGLGSSLAGMASLIPHLPKIDLTLPETIIHTDTIPSMQSGLLYGYIAEVEGLLEKMDEELPGDCVRLLTGGYSNLLYPHFKRALFVPDLLNDGLFEIYQRVNKKK